jgi:hypothetical protein
MKQNNNWVFSACLELSYILFFPLCIYHIRHVKMKTCLQMKWHLLLGIHDILADVTSSLLEMTYIINFYNEGFMLVLTILWTIYRVIGQLECGILVSISFNLFNSFSTHLTGFVFLRLVTFICYLSVFIQPSYPQRIIIWVCSSDLKDMIFVLK